MRGTWQTTSGGDPVAVFLGAGAVVVICAAVTTAAEAVASIPAWILVAIPAGIVAGVTVAVVALARHTRRRGAVVAALFAARRAEVAAAEEARALQRDQRRLALEQARTPVNHIHVWPSAEAAHTAMTRGYAPATVISDAQEITR